MNDVNEYFFFSKPRLDECSIFSRMLTFFHFFFTFSQVFSLKMHLFPVNLAFFLSNPVKYGQIAVNLLFMGPQPGTQRVIRAVKRVVLAK